MTPPPLGIPVPVLKAMVNGTVEYEIPLFTIVAIMMEGEGGRGVSSVGIIIYSLLPRQFMIRA